MLNFKLPNVRKMFVPDPGYTMFDCDLQQADAQVVAWEANDDKLKEIFRDPDRDLHNENTETIFGKCTGGKDPNRPKAKAGVHLTNYGGNANILSATLGITRHQAENFQTRWFQEHPGIKAWHESIEMQLQTKRYIENRFGFRRYYFDRIDNLLKEALAWIPQSTVALTINKGMLNIYNNMSDEAQLLLQVHDSVVGQYKTHMGGKIKPKLKDNLLIEIPYDDPLIIGVDIATSNTSWGDVKTTTWN